MTNIPTSAFYDRAGRQMGALRELAETLQSRLGSGSSIERSSDDPLGAARLRMLERRQHLADVFQGNSDRAMGDLTNADGALSSMANTITRLKELALRAANAATSDVDRASIAVEVEQLQETLMASANVTNLAGDPVFGGEGNGPAFTRDASGNIIYNGTANAPTLNLEDGQQAVHGFVGSDVFSFTRPDGTPTDIFAVAAQLAEGLRQPTTDAVAAAKTAMGALDAGLEKVTTTQTVIGVRMNWIDTLDDRRAATGEMANEEQARVGGADMAQTITRLQQVMSVLEASQASFVRLTGLSLFDQLR